MTFLNDHFVLLLTKGGISERHYRTFYQTWKKFGFIFTLFTYVFRKILYKFLTFRNNILSK